MSERIKRLAQQAKDSIPVGKLGVAEWIEAYNQALAELIVKDVLDEVAQRAYYIGDRAWSDDVDRPWIEMEYGMGHLADAQRQAGIIK